MERVRDGDRIRDRDRLWARVKLKARWGLFGWAGGAGVHKSMAGARCHLGRPWKGFEFELARGLRNSCQASGRRGSVPLPRSRAAVRPL